MTTKPTAERMTLHRLAREYLLERDVGKPYRDLIELVVRLVRRWHGETVYVDELSDSLVNGFLAHNAKRLKPNSLGNYRRMLLTLWRSAYDRELVSAPPRRVRKITNPVIIPVAWSQEEVQRLLVATDGFCRWHVHRSAKVSTGLFWKALILTVWDTGLRRVDWERLKRSDIAADGTIHLVQHKTGWPIRCTVRPETIAAIDATCPGNREFIFGHGGSGRARSFARLVKRAGLTGSLKKLRKSSATAVEIACPGSASAHLGHKNPTMAGRHYVDPRLVADGKARPPALEQPKPAGGADILAWL